jgi:hypothetical protein
MVPLETHAHDIIDRISPWIRPDRTAVMHQDWHHTLFLHWVFPNKGTWLM